MEGQSALTASIDNFLLKGTEILFSNIVFYISIIVSILFTVLTLPASASLGSSSALV